MASVTLTPPVEPRKVVPLQDCKQCYGSGEVVDWVDYGSTVVSMPSTCECVLSQLDNDNEPFTIDTTPNDLTKWVDVVEGV